MIYETSDPFFDAYFDERLRYRWLCEEYDDAVRDFRSLYIAGGEL